MIQRSLKNRELNHQRNGYETNVDVIQFRHHHLFSKQPKKTSLN